MVFLSVCCDGTYFSAVFFCAKVLSRPPVWLRKVCRSYLQQIVSEPDGVLNVLISTVLGMAYLLCNLCWCK